MTKLISVIYKRLVSGLPIDEILSIKKSVKETKSRNLPLVSFIQRTELLNIYLFTTGERLRRPRAVIPIPRREAAIGTIIAVR